MNGYFCHGQMYRYPKSKEPVPPELDGLPNYWHITHVAGQKRALLDRGLSSIAPVAEDDWSRVPAILVRTSHHRRGTADTPWHDRYEIEEGRVVYFGDAKPVHMPNPETAPGNKALNSRLSSWLGRSPSQA